MKVCLFASVTKLLVSTLALIAQGTEAEVFISAFTGGNTGVETIIRVDPQSGQQILISSGKNLTEVDDIAAAGTGQIFATAYELEGMTDIAKLIRIDTATGAQAAILTTRDAYFGGVAVAPDNSVVVSAYQGPDPGVETVIRVNPQTGAKTVVSSGGSLSEVEDVAVAANGDIFVTDYSQSGGTDIAKLIRIHPVTGAQTPIITNRNAFFSGLAMAPDESVVISAFIGGDSGEETVLRVNPKTGAQTVVTSGGNLLDVQDIAVAANGDILATDYTQQGATDIAKLIRIDPITGSQTTAITQRDAYFGGIYIAAAVAETMLAPTWTEGHLQLTLTGNADLPYRIEATTNLVDWASVYTSGPTNIRFTYVDTNSGNFRHRFYRAISGSQTANAASKSPLAD